MKTNNLLLIIVLTCYSTILLAQADSLQSTTEKSKITYFNNLLTGVAFGETGDGGTVTLSTTHGVRYKRFFLGGGIGYDLYDDGWRILPVFATAGFDFWQIKNNVFFIQASYGYADAWSMSNRREDLPNYESNGGKMLAYSLGYRLNADKMSLYISAGYKFQRLSYQYDLWSYWLDSYAPAQPPSFHYQKDMERLVVQIGIGFH